MGGLLSAPAAPASAPGAPASPQMASKLKEPTTKKGVTRSGKGTNGIQFVANPFGFVMSFPCGNALDASQILPNFAPAIGFYLWTSEVSPKKSGGWAASATSSDRGAIRKLKCSAPAWLEIVAEVVCDEEVTAEFRSDPLPTSELLHVVNVEDMTATEHLAGFRRRPGGGFFPYQFPAPQAWGNPTRQKNA